ncbi:hypothetical protein FA13DRAFT_960048 [Coprinellus micaceus]|uniref:F-box domain-containing protein n=1 Tax=Coprinellus micaceus TaxID=71717 RepID=A0A4Y7SZI3_COPMI|nr:hypothetical protein FA13DRAFT_960048 [Coprinellus micaceus]
MEMGGYWGNIDSAKETSAMQIWESVTKFAFEAGHDVPPAYQYPLRGQRALRMLKSLPQLSECVLTLESEYGHIPVQLTPTPLPNLTRLAFTSHPPPPRFASSLDLPLLKHVDLTCHVVDIRHLPQSESDDGALGLLQRLGHQLQVVTLHPRSILPRSLRRYLQLLPNVVSLEIHGTDARASPLWLRLSSTSHLTSFNNLGSALCSSH